MKDVLESDKNASTNLLRIFSSWTNQCLKSYQDEQR